MPDQPQCSECGRFVPYERATLCGGLDGFPSPSWDEWWEAICVRCEERLACEREAQHQEEMRQLEEREMEEHFRRHPHG